MLNRKYVVDKSLAPQEWIALLSWCISQIANDLCIQNIWIYFLYHNSILLLFLWHSPVECNPLCTTLLRIVNYKYLLSLSRSVTRSLPVEKGHRATGNQRRIYDVLLCLSNRHYRIKGIPSSIISSLLQTFSFCILRSSPLLLKSQATRAVLWCYPSLFSSFLSFVPL